MCSDLFQQISEISTMHRAKHHFNCLQMKCHSAELQGVKLRPHQTPRRAAPRKSRKSLSFTAPRFSALLCGQSRLGAARRSVRPHLSCEITQSLPVARALGRIVACGCSWPARQKKSDIWAQRIKLLCINGYPNIIQT